MAEKDFRKLVDDYLANRISPDELKWLRQKVATDDHCRNTFQRKCSQHQVSQYFMVQEAAPSVWQVDSEEEKETKSSIHLDNEEDLPNYDDQSFSTEMDEDETGPAFQFRDFLDFAFLSGLACITVVLSICWLDRSRLFSPETTPDLNLTPPAVRTFVRNVEYPAGVYHHLLTPSIDPPQPVETNQENTWLTIHQLDWYIRNQFPQSVPLDQQKLYRLQRTWDLPPDTFPHSIINQSLQTP